MASTSTGPTGSTSSTAQPPYAPRDLGGNFKCLDCEDQEFGSDRELNEHRQKMHNRDADAP